MIHSCWPGIWREMGGWGRRNVHKLDVSMDEVCGGLQQMPMPRASKMASSSRYNSSYQGMPVI